MDMSHLKRLLVASQWGAPTGVDAHLAPKTSSTRILIWLQTSTHQNVTAIEINWSSVPARLKTLRIKVKWIRWKLTAFQRFSFKIRRGACSQQALVSCGALLELQVAITSQEWQSPTWDRVLVVPGRMQWVCSAPKWFPPRTPVCTWAFAQCLSTKDTSAWALLQHFRLLFPYVITISPSAIPKREQLCIFLLYSMKQWVYFFFFKLRCWEHSSQYKTAASKHCWSSASHSLPSSPAATALLHSDFPLS